MIFAAVIALNAYSVFVYRLAGIYDGREPKILGWPPVREHQSIEQLPRGTDRLDITSLDRRR